MLSAARRQQGSRLALWGWAAAITLAAFWLRYRARHAGLIYPDGYQYLLMAKGIAEHLRPTLALGQGGYLFAPSPDAALKPLYPALVAALSPLGGLRVAGALITALAAALTVTLTGTLAGRLTGSRAAGALAALAALASPALAYWSGFMGPDPLAGALGLSCALAISYRRATLAGALGALCMASRPEWGLALAAFALCSLALAERRADAWRGLMAAMFTLALILGVLRPPLASPPGGLTGALGALLAGALLQLAAACGARRRALAGALAAASLAGVAALACSGYSTALNGLLAHEWPLFCFAALGLALAVVGERAREALAVLAGAGLLGACYLYRNPGSERYLSELIPLACVLGSFALAAALRLPARVPRSLGRPARIALRALTASLALGGALSAPARAPLGTDTFQSVAAWLNSAPPGPLVSAAPDAYGYLLAGRTQLLLAPGQRGLILIDGAARAYEPGLSVSGKLIASYRTPDGFLDPDGTLDLAPVRLYRGVVIKR